MSEVELFSFIDEVKSLPSPGNQDFLKVGHENWLEIISDHPVYSSFGHNFGETKVGRQILDAIFGNSPYLSQCLLKDLEFFSTLIRSGSNEALSWIYQNLKPHIAPQNEMTVVMAALRTAKKRIALLTALADMAESWSLLTITKTLSDFAAFATDCCISHLLLAAHTKGELVLPHPENPVYNSGLIILGMGKLGAFELNYSSDIDLIILFDTDRITYTGRKSVHDCFVKIARNLVKMMQERTADGYVFRTDLRLRPDPGATPPALPLAAAHTYYESQGQNWERAAMIKARPIAGDLVAGEEFIDFLQPFIWRKFLDFAAIADIQAIKLQIHTHKGFGKISLDGHNIKIGRGGIREIEFFCQTQQLIEGGRNPALRLSTTLGTLQALTDFGKVELAVRDDLTGAYIFLRTLEHRLQMIQDEQTQLLPEKEHDLDRLGVFMGYDDASIFRSTLENTLKAVKNHYDALFHFEENEERLVGRLVFTGAEDDPETLLSLQDLGYEDTSTISKIIREWHHGRYRATRTVRAQQLLTTLMPVILENLANTVKPDAAFMRFDAFLKKLPAGVQLFSLFNAHPSLLQLVAKIMGMAPQLADRLSTNPLLLDGVLSPDFMGPLQSREELTEDLEFMLETGRDFQDVLDISRRWLNDLKFRVGVQILDNIDHENSRGATVTAGASLTCIAEIVMQVLLPHVKGELEEKHGQVPGGEFVVIAAGKLGSREMTPGSDADLIFVFNTETEDVMTDGLKPIPSGLFYTRLSQRFINTLSALTGEGRLYEVDMRLRPHGKSGPIALPLEGFKKYYAEDAWTWEHLALTRARVVAGDPILTRAVSDTLKEIVSVKREPAQVAKDVYDMQTRLHKEHVGKSIWALKNHPGGLMDLEFICQYLKLIQGLKHPAILIPNTIESFQRMGSENILTAEQSEKLTSAMSFYLNLQGLIRLSLSERIVTDQIPTALKQALSKAGNQPDFESLTAHIEKTQKYVSHCFKELIPSS
ncbi:MAG: bifunctional [glutamine synthetase] adenylyltransferase/[glutamine synthetase]-adenylyl-L-tyrosine phosphorylase [Sneathiella sp.]|nr:bifunctional [glutamine synthetase] adenylyltransferase/[glutamine synthetase]-adenylyl-L-tyrosine phosphorylase [Sneathiella sp.]